MGRFFGLVMVLGVVGVGAYIYMRQAQNATLASTSDPQATLDVVGVKRDLMSIARSERVHMGLYGKYGSIEELRSSGDLAMERNSRGPYSYSIELNSSGFRVVATYSGPQNALASKTISVDQSMQFSTER
jgi:hypothetical protein